MANITSTAVGSYQMTFAEYKALPFWKRWFTNREFSLEEKHSHFSQELKGRYEKKLAKTIDFQNRRVHKLARRRLKRIYRLLKKGNNRTIFRYFDGVRELPEEFLMLRKRLHSLSIEHSDYTRVVIIVNPNRISEFTTEYLTFMEERV